MASKVRCPACGKRIRVSDTDAGLHAVCPACGGRVDVPPAELLGPVRRDNEAASRLPSEAGNDAAPDVAIRLAPNPDGASIEGTPTDGATPGVERLAGDSEALAAAVAARSTSAATLAPAETLAPADTDGATTGDPAAPRPAPPDDRVAGNGSAFRGLAPPANPAPSAADLQAVRDAWAARGARREESAGHPLWWVLLGAVACTVVGFAFFVATGRLDPWEDAHRAAIIELKAQAEAQAADDRLAEALSTYQSLEGLLAGRELRDPALRGLAEAARADRQKVFSIVLARKMALATARAQADATAARAAAAPKIVPSSLPQAAPVPAAGSKTDPGREAQPAAPAPQPSVSRRPAPRPAPTDRAVITDDRIGDSIQKGVDYLLDQFDPETHLLRGDHGNGDPSYAAGLDALSVYALLQCGYAVNDPRLNVRGPTMKALLDALKALPMEGGSQTYARALRSTCLAVFNRPEDLKVLQDDADFLMGTCSDGAYTYTGQRSPRSKRTFSGKPRGWDNSNSQYGLLGVWSAIDAEPSIEVPLAYWQAVERHWTECQLSDGEWSYTQGGGRLSMTCAGIASLFVTHEYLEPSLMNAGGFDLRRATTTVGREPYSPALKRALNWFEEGDHAMGVPDRWWGYTLYGIERVGLASGFKHFGVHDWYRELAAEVVRRQRRRGEWAEGPIDTSYALLFLSRGRHPVLMNKLRFDRRGQVASSEGTYWCNRTRDVANAARFAGRQLERPINWQVVSVENPWQDWMDSPILYIASHEPPKLTDADYNKLRQFVEAGGMIFTHADVDQASPNARPGEYVQGSASFTAWAAALGKRLFPENDMADLPADHPIYNVVFKPTPRPPLRAVTNGSRVLLLHSPVDLALRWQQRTDRQWESRTGITASPDAAHADEKARQKAQDLAPFQLGVNIFIYAAGKRDLRNRLDSPWVGPPSGQSVATIKVARLQYGGHWDPEPGAWPRYANWFRQQTSYQLDVHAVSLSDLKLAEAPFAHLTGAAGYAFTPAETTALKNYVRAGGVVLVDACGGEGPFADSIRTMLTETFPAEAPLVVQSDHPLLTASAPGMEEIPRPRLRQFTIERLGSRAGAPALLMSGKGHILVTNLDLTSGLLGTRTWGILGYEPTYAQSLLSNALFWTIDGQPDKAGEKVSINLNGAIPAGRLIRGSSE